MSRINKLVAGVVLAGGAALAGGCHSDGSGWHWHDDPCWPDRYANESRAAVVANFQPQVENGQILDQTIWNSGFEFGTDRLNGAGMDKLDQIARRRPSPDPRVFIQTARDLGFDGAKPEVYAGKRQELDTKRVAAVQKYLAASLTGRPARFDVQIHDPSMPGIEGAAPRLIVPSPQTRVGAAAPAVVAPGGVPPAGAAVPPPPAPAGSYGGTGTTTGPRM